MIQNNDNIIKGIVGDFKGNKYNSYRRIELKLNILLIRVNSSSSLDSIIDS